MYATPLIFGAMGGLVSEKSGVTNIGIEGMMSLGASTAVCVTYATGHPWAGFLAAGAAAGVLALLHAAASVSLRADQTVSGIAINLIGPGISLFMTRQMFGVTNTPAVPAKLPKIFGNKAGEGALSYFNFDITVILALVLTVLAWFIFYKTKWGLRVRAVGEHPQVADTLGISVYTVSYTHLTLPTIA